MVRTFILLHAAVNILHCAQEVIGYSFSNTFSSGFLSSRSANPSKCVTGVFNGVCHFSKALLIFLYSIVSFQF